jgi:asparagine synthase (glutamine-hydrolysing)
MCGILGVVGRPVDRANLERMAGAMRHRGPDSGGFLTWADGALAHRRLSILDVSTAADQPFTDPLQRAALVFNGEIYNYLELRAELEGHGHAFRTGSDTEVLLASYLQWGEACVERLNGMFAFAVWDRRRQALFLARDRFGKKPLFYARLDGCLLFASELKPFLASGLVSADLDPEALLDYLHLNYVLCPKTPLSQVRQLPPAHRATWQAGRWHSAPYWDLADSLLEPRFDAPDEELTDRLGELLDDATRVRLFSDVPLGAFLSGGVDSSTVVAAMRRAGAPRLHTFSVEFSPAEFNEGVYARLAARHLSTEHHPRLVEGPPLDLLGEFAERMDVPLGDDSAISTYLLSRHARERVTVALSGDGADELFAGYETYQADALHRRLGPLRRPAAWLLGLVGPWLPERGAKLSRRFRAEQFRLGLEGSAARAHFAWRQVGRPPDGPGWLAPELAEAARGYSPADTFLAHHERVKGADWLDRMLYVDCMTWLPDDILVKVDRASMAASLEARAPFLDYRLAEFAARMPRRLKLCGRQKKVALRALARRRLPSEIVDRRKAGFNSPTADWLRGPLRGAAEELLRGPLQSLGVRWQPALAGRWEAFLRGERRHQYALWGLFCLALWQRHVVAGGHEGRDGRPAPEPCWRDLGGPARWPGLGGTETSAA